MKKKKPQVTKNILNWVPPEKRMKTYEDFGIVHGTPMTDPKWKKVKWIDFRIVVPDQYTKDQLLAAFEFIHDNNSVMDNDFMAVNSIAHSYLTPEREPGTIPRIIVDPELFRKVWNVKKD